MKVITRCIVLICLFVVLPRSSWAQGEVGKYEASMSWTYLTGDFGLNGFTPAFGYRFHTYVTLVGEGNFLWDTSKIGAFTLVSTTGQFSIHSNFQNGLGGARVHIFHETRKLDPFGEFMIGYSRLSQSISTVTGVFNGQASTTGFTWMFGGGADYRLSNSWAARGRLDFMRTHFINEGQSRLRVGIGLVYHF